MTTSLILASGSTARRTLLRNAGLDFSAETAQVDERAVEAALAPADQNPCGIAMHLAIAKARDVAGRHSRALVIGCDQTMSVGDDVHHKAKSIEEARATLMSLRGRVHHLNSAVCLVRNGDVLWSHLSTAVMRFRDFSDSFLDGYMERNIDVVLASVGGYQLEGEGIQLFETIEGDYFTILGLPLLPLIGELRKLGVNHA